MKRLSTGALALLMAAGLGLNAVAAQTQASHGNIGTNAIAQDQGSTMAAPPANFGSPPSGQIPILYNDHHVYTKPDVLKQARVLAALVRGGTILIPLRSMFEQMGPPYPTVSWDGASKTVTVSKPGAEVKVTVGKPEVVINGESRPLDVPPIMYQGDVLVPVRVISEGMGAYVLWVADRHLVVVAYRPATPPPSPPPPPPPPPPTPTPTPMATPYHDLYVAGDYIISPKVYNQFSPGTTACNNCNGFSYRLHGAVEFDLLNLPWMVEGDYRQYNYQHPSGLVTAIGNQFQTFVPSFNASDYDLDARVGLRVLNPRIYIGVGYLWRSGNYGYPGMNNVGVGLEKLPDLNHPFSFYASGYYYWHVQGNCGTNICPTGPFTIAYDVLKYDVGVVYSFQGIPLFIEGGFLGDYGWNQQNAPGNFAESGPYVGLGIKF